AEDAVRGEIAQRAAFAFRAIQLSQGEREAFEHWAFHACRELGWTPSALSINPVDPTAVGNLVWGWRIVPAVEIRSRDQGALRQLANDYVRIVREVRDTEAARRLREMKP